MSKILDISKYTVILVIFTLNIKAMDITYIKDVECYVSPQGKKLRKSLFKCFCGKEFTTNYGSVKSGNTKSCGCIRKEKPNGLKHGKYGTPLYKNGRA